MNNMSESSVYYDANRTNLIEEYSNINKLNALDEKDEEEEKSLEKPKTNQNNTAFGSNNVKSGNNFKYFSHLNV